MVTVYPRGAASYQPELAKGAGVTEEIRYFLNIIESKQENMKNPPESAAQSVRLVSLLEESSNHGGRPVVLKEEV